MENKTETANINNRLGEMITIPAGDFMMGSDPEDQCSTPEEYPKHKVYLPEYKIAKYQVTRGEYRKFMEDGGYSKPEYWSEEGWKWKESDVIAYNGLAGSGYEGVKPNRNQPLYWEEEQEWIGHDHNHPKFMQTDMHPVVGVTYYEAEAYCKWAGGRLPTEAEWEKAARWDEENKHSRIWPWGDEWDAEKCNNCDTHNPAAGGYKTNMSSPVGSFPEGASPYGCLDIVGNAYEWVSDWAKSYPGNPEPFDHTGFRFVRGGCWDDPQYSNRCAYRGWYLLPHCGGVGEGDCDYIGFRVAL